MIKRIFNLASTITSDFFTKYSNKKRDPMHLLKKGVENLEEKQITIQEQFCQCNESLKVNREIFNTKIKEREKMYAEAKKFKADGLTHKAAQDLKLVVRIDEWLDKNQESILSLEKRKQELKDLHDEVLGKIQEYNLEISLIKTTKSIANSKIDQYEQFGVDFTGIDKLLKESNDKVDLLNQEAQAHVNTHKALGGEVKDSNDIDDRVKKMMDEL